MVRKTDVGRLEIICSIVEMYGQIDEPGVDDLGTISEGLKTDIKETCLREIGVDLTRDGLRYIAFINNYCDLVSKNNREKVSIYTRADKARTLFGKKFDRDILSVRNRRYFEREELIRRYAAIPEVPVIKSEPVYANVG